MPRSLVSRSVAAAGAVAGLGLVAQVLLAGPAGAVTTTKVELKAGNLRVEGHAGSNARLCVESTLSATCPRADQNGLFRVQATGFSAPDCKLTIRDNQTPTATVSIPNCTPSTRPAPAPAGPTGRCVITPQPAATTFAAGSDAVFWMYATGCDTSSPLWFTFVGGALPTGMYMGTFQNSTSGNIIGTPSIRGSYTFTVQAQDGAGNTDQETFTIKVV